MIQAVVTNLKKMENPISDKLLSIFDNTQTKVDSSFYTSTIFQSWMKYRDVMDSSCSDVEARLSKTVWNTPLSFVRGNCTTIFYSTDNQGVDFGITMVDYRTKKPLIVITVEKKSDYQMKSLCFEKGQYVEKTTNVNPSNTKDLYESFFNELSSLVNKFLPVK